MYMCVYIYIYIYIYTRRFIMYSRITKIYYRKTVGHIFTKPVQVEGTTQNFFFPVSCFSSQFIFLPLGDASVCSEIVGKIIPAPIQTGPVAQPASCTMGDRVFPRGVKCGRGVLLTTHHFPVPRSWKSSAVPLPTLWATPGL